MKHFLTAVILSVLISGPGFADESLFSEIRTKREGVVAQIKEPDYIVLEGGERIQLIGLKAEAPPRIQREIEYEVGYGATVIEKEETDPAKSIEEQAMEFVRDLLEGEKVTIEIDEQKRDEDWHTYAYVFLNDGRMANVEILRNGFAHLKITPPNVKYAGQLREAYQEARREMRGFQSE